MTAWKTFPEHCLAAHMWNYLFQVLAVRFRGVVTAGVVVLAIVRLVQQSIDCPSAQLTNRSNRGVRESQAAVPLCQLFAELWAPVYDTELCKLHLSQAGKSLRWWNCFQYLNLLLPVSFLSLPLALQPCPWHGMQCQGETCFPASPLQRWWQCLKRRGSEENHDLSPRLKFSLKEPNQRITEPGGTIPTSHVRNTLNQMTDMKVC